VLCDEQQDAPVRRFEGGQQPPCAIQIQPANGRKLLTLQPRTSNCASAPAYVVNS
jgi:hypothetical protein